MDARYARESLGAAAGYVTGLINRELLLKNEYLAAENRILRAHLPARAMSLQACRKLTMLGDCAGRRDTLCARIVAGVRCACC
jgi:hypothetical protein